MVTPQSQDQTLLDAVISTTVPSWFLGTIRPHAANRLWIEGLITCQVALQQNVFGQEELNRALTIHGLSYLFLIEIQGAQVALRT